LKTHENSFILQKESEDSFFYCEEGKVIKMSNENLIPFNERTEEEQRELARMGGIASGEARRRKRDIKDTLDILLSKPFKLKNKGYKSIVTQLKSLGIDESEIDNQMAMTYALFLTTLNGSKNSVNAFNSIRDTLGEKPTEKIKADVDTDVNIKIELSDD